MNNLSFLRFWQLVDRLTSRRGRRARRSSPSLRSQRARPTTNLALEALEDRVVPAVDHLVVTTEPPSQVTAGAGFSVVVKAETSTNHVDTAFTGKITLTDYNQQLNGAANVSKNAVAGVATFSGLTLTKASSYEYLYATATGLTGAYTSSFNVVAAAATQLVDGGPAGDVQANQAFSHTFNAEDTYGNVNTSFSGSVTVALSGGTAGATLGGTLTVPASSGTAYFSDLTIDKFGTGYTLVASTTGLTNGTSAAFNATGKWVVTTAPPSSVTAGDQFGLTAMDEDGAGNVDTSYTGTVTIAVSYPSSSTLGGTVMVQANNGVVSWSDLALTDGGYHQLSMSSTGVVTGTTDYVNVTGGPATHLAISQQPPTTANSSSAPFTVVVQALDKYNIPDPNYSASISLALDNNPTGANLHGTTPVTAAAGSAYFSGIYVDRAGTGYTLQATAGGLGSVDTSAFDVQDSLVATTSPPSRIVTGATFNMVVDIEVASGVVDTSYNGPVTMIVDNFSGGTTDTFQGPTSVMALNGVATFSGMSITELGYYGFVVSAQGMADLVQLFNVVGGPATQLVVATQPAVVTAGSGFSLTVNAEDAAGNLDSGYSGYVYAAMANNPGGATLGGSLGAYASNGVATFSGLTLDHTGSGYTISLASGTLTPVTSAPIHATPPKIATQLVVTTQPYYSTAAGTGFGLVAKAEDGAGNVDTTFSGNVTVTAVDGTAVHGTTTVKAASGVATFSGLTMSQPGSYMLKVASGNLTGATSNSYSIVAGKATQLVVSAPTQSVLTNTAFTVTATAEDKYGNVATGFYGYVKLALGSNPGKATLGGLVSAYASSGVVTFSAPTINKPGAGYTLTASYTGLTMGTSPKFNVTTDQLVVTTQPPASVALGAGFGFAVSAENGAGTVDSTFTGNVTVALIDFGNNGPTFGGTRTVAAVQGVATFSGLTVDRPGNYALAATAAGLGSGSSNAFAANAVATKLVVTTQPPATITSNTGFGLAVMAEDANNNVDTTVQGTVTLTIANNPAAGTLGGTTTATLQNGVATFSGLTLDMPGTGYTLQAASGALTAATSNAINVTPLGVAAQLVVTTPPPTSVATGNSFGLTVKAEDGSGNVDTNFAGTVTVALSSSGTGATLGGTFTMPATAGVATFTDLTLSPPGFYGLTASASGMPTVSIGSIVVTPGSATELDLLSTAGPIVAGSPFGLTLIAVDGQGDIDQTFQGNVALALGASAGGAGLSGVTTVAAKNGLVTFTGLTINQPASGVTLTASATGLTPWTLGPFDVTSGQLVVTNQPASTIAAGAGFGLVAKVMDGQGRLVSSFKGTALAELDNFGTNVASLGGPVLVTITGGVATFANLSITSAGSYGLTLVGPGLAPTDTNAFGVSAAKATQLVITTQAPTTVTAGSAFEVDVTAQDKYGNTDPNFTGAVTMGVATGTPGGTLGGTPAHNAVRGIASFPGLTLSLTGSYTLKASASGVASATSTAVNVTAAGLAANLVATTAPPTSMSAGSTFGLTVTAEDSTGAIDTSFSGNVTLTIDGGATLNGTVSMAASHGVAAFTGLSVNQAGTYNLSAASGALVPAVAPISVNAGSATQMLIQPPPAAIPGSPFEIDVFAADGNQNLDTSFSGNVTLSLVNNPGGAMLGGTLTVAAQNGIASFTGLTLDKTGTGYTVKASSTGLPDAASGGFDVDQDQLVVTAQPSGLVFTGTGFGVTVTAEDSAGHTNASFNGDITLTLNSLDGSVATLGGKATVPAVNGIATFTGLTVNHSGDFTLAATSTGVLTTGTNEFLVAGTVPASKAPAITSGPSASFEVGVASTFTITTTGYPVAAISLATTPPPGLTFSDNGDGTATISGTPTAPTSTPVTLNVTATNGVGVAATQKLMLTINQAPTINAFTPPVFIAGTQSSVTITTTPGVPSATTLSYSGTLPKGISFSATGGTASFKGTPAVGSGGTYSITLTARNAPNSSVSQTFTMTVNEAPTITSKGSAVFSVGQTGTFTVTTKDYPTVTFSASPLPAGLTFTDNHNGTATISGKPTALTSTTVTITASNGVGADLHQPLQFTINDPPTIAGFTAPVFAIKTLTSFTISTTAGVPAATTLTVKGALPGGVTFTDNHNGTGTFKGTPTTGNGGVFPITFVASNGAGSISTQTFNLDVKQAPVFSSAATATFSVGKFASFVIATKGYPVAAITRSGVLPGGITFTDNGDGTATLSGTAVAGADGPYTFVFTASNGNSPNATQTFKLTVKA
jgi:dUTPase